MRKSKPKGHKGFIKKLTESNAPLNVTSGGYEAPTVGYEDVLYSHGTTKAAAEFRKVNTRLARYVSMQSWSGATIAGRAMENLAEPKLVEPTMPSSQEEFEKEVDQVIKDESGQDKTVQIIVTGTRPEDAAKIKFNMEIYMIHYKAWMTDELAWKTNRSRIYVLVLMHCPPDLKEVLKTLSTWNAVRDDQDAIGLLKLICNVAHDQTEAKQTTMGFVESIAELFTYHQSEKESNNEYSIMFNVMVE